MSTVIVHTGSLDALAAAVVVKSSIDGEVEMHEVKAGEPFPISADQVADAEVWALGISTSAIEYWHDFEKCHVINCDHGTAHFIDKEKRPWFTHGMEFAEVCPDCTYGIVVDYGRLGGREPQGPEDCIPCPTCKGTGGKFLRGRSLCVAAWLSLYPQVKTNCAVFT